MNHNEEVPDNLGGLGDLLPADVLKMVNELLEQLHRKGKDHQGGIVLNIYEKGSLHVDHVDTQNTSMVKPVLGRHNYKKIILHRLCHHRSAALKRWCYGRRFRKQAMWMPTINRSFPERRRHCWPMQWRSGWASRRSGRCSKASGTGSICGVITIWPSPERDHSTFRTN